MQIDNPVRHQFADCIAMNKPRTQPSSSRQYKTTECTRTQPPKQQQECELTSWIFLSRCTSHAEHEKCEDGSSSKERAPRHRLALRGLFLVGLEKGKTQLSPRCLDASLRKIPAQAGQISVETNSHPNSLVQCHTNFDPRCGHEPKSFHN